MAQNATRVGWVSADSGRDTSSILWSCFSVLLVCTWSCIHLNLPSIEESEAGFRKCCGIPYFPSTPLLRKWRRKVIWMLGIIIAPEVGVVVATADYMYAKNGLAHADSFHGEIYSDRKKEVDDVLASVGAAQIKIPREQLTISHAFLANMGGFKIALTRRQTLRTDPETANSDEYNIQEERRRDPAESATTIKKIHAEKTYITEYWVGDFAELERWRIKFPDIQMPSEEDIKGRSKSDGFTKTFACVQSAWLCIQCIARASQGLPITQLELSTVAFVFCGIWMYLLWWDKPFGVERRESLVATDVSFSAASAHEKRDIVQGILATRDLDRLKLRRYRAEMPRVFEILRLNFKREDMLAISNRFYRALRRVSCFSMRPKSPNSPELNYPTGMMLAFYLSSYLFSGFHLLAWNWDFPSDTIRICWRVFATVATGANPVIILVSWVDLVYLSGTMVEKTTDRLLMVTYFFVAVSYCLARVGLIVLIFFCFSSMPEAAYESVEWTKFLPHFS